MKQGYGPTGDCAHNNIEKLKFHKFLFTFNMISFLQLSYFKFILGGVFESKF